MTQQEHREKLYRLYVRRTCEEMADCRDDVAWESACIAYQMERNNYFLQYGEQYGWRDYEDMYPEMQRRVA